jgi:hypothetical protein
MCFPRVKILIGLVILLASSCSQAPPPPPPKPQPINPVGEVSLIRADVTPQDEKLLDIGIRVFAAESTRATRAELGDWIFDEIIQKETMFLPHLLKDTLEESNQWGPIRVLPEPDPSMDLLVTGTILKSDGHDLELQIQATDSTGRIWLDKIYSDTAVAEDYPEATRFASGFNFDAANFIDPYEDLYDKIANELLQQRELRSNNNLRNINVVADLAYAIDLAPESFADTLVKDEQGFTQVNLLPADNDPMMARVKDMRFRHHLFIDTVDEYYQTLYDDIQPAYVLWRRYSIDQIIEEEEALADAGTSDYGSSNGFLSLSQRYDRYKWSKIFEQEFTQLASGFNNELAPAILELNEQVHGLNGTMEQQYRQWRGILRRLFELETGVEN